MSNDKKVSVVNPSSAIGKKMVHMNLIKEEKADLDKKYKDDEDGVKKYLQEEKVEEVLVDDGTDELLSGMTYERVSVSYDQEKLKTKLKPDQYKEVTDEIFVVSKTGLNQFIKAHPTLKDELKQFIVKSTTLNEKKMDLAFERGVFTLDQIKGCYTTNVTEIFKFSKKKRPKKLPKVLP